MARKETTFGGRRVGRAVVLAAWLALVIVGATTNYLAEQNMEQRLADRVANGAPVEAEVVQVTNPWYAYVFSRDQSSTVVATVEYTIDGRSYQADVVWLEYPSNRHLSDGDKIRVYADRQELDLIATATGGGSDGWSLVVPRLLLAVWLVVVTLGAAAASIRLRRADTTSTSEVRAVIDIASRPTADGRPDVQQEDNVVFAVVLFGYHRADVEATVAAGVSALDSYDRLSRGEAAESLRTARHRVALRGYDREQVRQVTARLSALLTEQPGYGSGSS